MMGTTMRGPMDDYRKRQWLASHYRGMASIYITIIRQAWNEIFPEDDLVAKYSFWSLMQQKVSMLRQRVFR
jgi:hypothetical protein